MLLASVAGGIPVVARFILFGVFTSYVAFSELSRSRRLRKPVGWIVPARLVGGDDAAKVWGRALGYVFLTDVSYGVVNVSLVGPALLGEVSLLGICLATFFVVRLLPYLISASRAAIGHLPTRSAVGIPVSSLARASSTVFVVAALVSGLAQLGMR